MRAFWIILLLLLALPPLLLPFWRGTSCRDVQRKSALQVVAEVAPGKYKFVVAFVYLAVVIFVAAKVKGTL